MSAHVVWLVGRGVSMSCGLCWDIPSELEAAYRRGRIDRAALASRICEELERAEREPGVDLRPLRALAERLKRSGGRHSFATTNWDGLLARALREQALGAPLHLNGSVAERNILTAWDDERARDAVPQAREGLRRLMDADLVVVAGLSLANRLDQGLVSRLRGKRGGRWLVVNHDAAEVREACETLRERLAGCEVSAVNESFDEWVEAGLPGLGGVTPERAASDERAR
jgi:hypothetical protein